MVEEEDDRRADEDERDEQADREDAFHGFSPWITATAAFSSRETI